MAMSAAYQAASVIFDGLVRLCVRKARQLELVRLVRVQSERGEFLLVSNKAREELSAELLALIYRSRCLWNSFSNGSNASFAVSSVFQRASAAYPFMFISP